MLQARHARSTGAVGLRLAGFMVLLAVRWPFTTERIARRVAGSTGSRVVIRNSGVFFFPSPGSLAREVELRRGAEDTQPIARVRRLRFIGSWSALLTFQHRLKRLEAEGLVVMLPKRVPGRDPSATYETAKATGPSLLIADGSILEAAPDLRFQFERLRLRNSGPGETFTFDTVVQKPNHPIALRQPAASVHGTWATEAPASIGLL